MKLKKKLLCLTMAALMTVGMAGCGGSGENGETASNGEEITLGTTSWPTNMFFYLAEEKGFFEENGVNVSIQDFSSTTESTNAFVGGKLDFCTFASSETISPFFQGADMSVVLETDKSNGCEGLVATSDIKSVADLKGKTVATQLYSVDHMFLLTLLEENGMTEDDINIVDMSIQESGNAFVAGQCDAACIWDPYFSQAKAAGGTELFSSADNPDLITDVLCASKELCSSNPKAVKGVIQGFFDAVDYWKANPDEANAFMGEKLGVDGEEFANEVAGLIISDPESCKEAFTKADDYSYWGYTQNTIRDFMYKLGVLDSNEKDCGELIDSSFINEIAQ
ncbi:MAG: ABC transporter substrate-binding protein [Clostridia bacterium]|nr:ABC transporter substrate-binding protein [Clostridia bacterium]